jgi:hypothetical protein
LNLIPVLLIALEQLSGNLKYNLTIENGVWWIWRDGESWPLDGMERVSVTKELVIVYIYPSKQMLMRILFIDSDGLEVYEE